MYGSNLKSHYPQRYIEEGDKIFVRIIRSGETLLEFVVDNVASYTDLVGEIRYMGQYMEGLTDVFIRNFSRGWSMTRPMMFYPGVSRPRRKNEPKKRMLFPWETH
ncbi:MAG: hypothetical protein K2L83_06550 [Muribaculaceae bacterium]|nr:hypothetical protein [Muribaculaceae bacterium]MDE6330355.1 hypothetical protein [Muribaculaceae bacterium]